MEMRNKLLETAGRDSCYKVAKKLVELCSTVLWKVELASNEIKYLDERKSDLFASDSLE